MWFWEDKSDEEPGIHRYVRNQSKRSKISKMVDRDEGLVMCVHGVYQASTEW